MVFMTYINKTLFPPELDFFPQKPNKSISIITFPMIFKTEDFVRCI